uniref:Uncharacterized protein n=1 Tax=Tetradesmus obliquus TaxID=3088 RepID=A0A383W110_TETOB
MYVGYGSSVLMNSSTSCITGNTDIGNSSSSTSSSSSSELATVPYDCDAHGPVLGAIFISGNSSVHFIGHAHRMGSNQGNGSNADIVVFSPPVEPERLRRGVPAGQSKSTFDTLRAARGMTQSKAQAVPPQRADQVQGLGNFNGFACDDKDAHTDGVYMMAGDVCGCDGNCTCQPPTQWIAGRCACV